MPASNQPHRRSDGDPDAPQLADLAGKSALIVAFISVVIGIPIVSSILTAAPPTVIHTFTDQDADPPAQSPDENALADDDSPDQPMREYVGSEACIDCHKVEYENWLGSDHHLAMQFAHEQFVRAPFNGETFESDGVLYRFLKKDGIPVIREESSNGGIRDWPVVYTFGHRPLQQYLIAMPDGRYQSHTVAWDTERNEWYDLYPDEFTPEGDELHWRGHNFTWNLMCAECHSTNLQKKYEPTENSYNTTYAEVSVGCESCHGPGSLHVELAEQEVPDWGGFKRTGLSVRLKDVPINKIEIDVCAKCHSRRQAVTEDFRPGQRFLEHFVPQLLEEDLYFHDGQIKDEVFVYGSFLQSRMYRENVRCSDCHEPHTGGLQFTGNALCTQCHSQTDYDSQLHHHHDVGTEGASCVECHMADRTYMVVDPRRDHSMRIPRPELTVRYGIPNACNDCHTKEEEDAAWAVEWIEKWYGDDRRGTPTFAHTFAMARRNQSEAVVELIDLIRGVEDNGPMVRATAASLLGRFVDQNRVTDFLARSLRDREVLVRMGSVRALELAAPEIKIELLPRALRDRSRIVRIEAGRILAPFAADLPGADDRRAFDRGLKEVQTALRVNADSPGSQLNRGVLLTDLGSIPSAMEAYKQALRINSEFVPAMINLALLEYETGRNNEAGQLLRQAIDVEPDFADAHFMLGLLVAEVRGNLEEAIAHFREAVRLAPDRVDMHYNLAAALQQTGRFEGAADEFREAVALEPAAVDLRSALLQILLRLQRWDEARVEVEELMQLDPQNPVWKQYRDAIESRDR